MIQMYLYNLAMSRTLPMPSLKHQFFTLSYTASYRQKGMSQNEVMSWDSGVSSIPKEE